jgi:hypothetical protein
MSSLSGVVGKFLNEYQVSFYYIWTGYGFYQKSSYLKAGLIPDKVGYRVSSAAPIS